MFSFEWFVFQKCVEQELKNMLIAVNNLYKLIKNVK